MNIQSGGVRVISYTPGDVDSSNTITPKDAIMLLRYIVGGYSAQISEAAADVDASGRLSPADAVLILRYIAGGYNVILKPAFVPSKHSMEEFPYKAPTCTEDGHAAYWYCSECGKYFNDPSGSTEIQLNDTVLKALGHIEVKIPAKQPTTTEVGYTEGIKCSRCGKILKAPQEIPMLGQTEYIVEYRFISSKKDITGEFIAHNNDPYLEQLVSQDKFINENPNSCYSHASFTLKDPKVEGYDFLGWFNGSDGAADRVRKIDHPSEHQVVYAHLIPHAYKVQYISPLSPKETEYHYVNEIFPLNHPHELPGYRFLGWTDKEVNLSDKIPMGIASDLVFTANWSSDRNITRPVEQPGDPVIDFDHEHNRIVFAYEIGTAENIPLAPIKFNGQESFNIRPGTKINETTRVSAEISENSAKTISNAIAEATTKSSAWTLSSEWNKAASISKEHQEEVDEEVLQSSSHYKDSSSNWNIGTSASGSHQTHTDSGISAKLGAKIGDEVSVGAPIKVKGLSTKISAEISAEVNTHYNTSTTDTQTWNANIGYSTSKSSGSSSALNHSLANKISDAVSYDISKAASEGYSISDHGLTDIVVSGNVGSSEIYASASVNRYSLSWSNGATCSITVERTSSPNAGARTGRLSSGDAIYYGDTLSISYNANTGHSISSHGDTNITVSGNVDSSRIYASAAPTITPIPFSIAR